MTEALFSGVSECEKWYYVKKKYQLPNLLIYAILHKQETIRQAAYPLLLEGLSLHTKERRGCQCMLHILI